VIHAVIPERIILALLLVTVSAFKVPAQCIGPHAKRPIEYVNTLVGTAPLDDPQVIGNAPPPGEELYSGGTNPWPGIPYDIPGLSPINKDVELSYPAGNNQSYNYVRRIMVGFSSVMPDLTVMPVVGDWTVPPERSLSGYDKAKERGTPGYYTV